MLYIKCAFKCPCFCTAHVTRQACAASQCDQMSLWKNRPKCIPIHFLSTTMHSYKRGKSGSKMCATFVITKNCPQLTTIQWAKIRIIWSLCCLPSFKGCICFTLQSWNAMQTAFKFKAYFIVAVPNFTNGLISQRGG
jgi:hypothetical protein